MGGERVCGGARGGNVCFRRGGKSSHIAAPARAQRAAGGGGQVAQIGMGALRVRRYRGGEGGEPGISLAWCTPPPPPPWPLSLQHGPPVLSCTNPVSSVQLDGVYSRRPPATPSPARPRRAHTHTHTPRAAKAGGDRGTGRGRTTPAGRDRSTTMGTLHLTSPAMKVLNCLPNPNPSRTIWLLQAFHICTLPHLGHSLI